MYTSGLLKTSPTSLYSLLGWNGNIRTDDADPVDEWVREIQQVFKGTREKHTPRRDEHGSFRHTNRGSHLFFLDGTKG